MGRAPGDGLFVVRAARNLAEAEAILDVWRPHMTVVDMDHDDSSAPLQRLGASNMLTRSVTPVLGLTRRGDLKTKLRAFDLGVDDILTVPFSPEELLDGERPIAATVTAPRVRGAAHSPQNRSPGPLAAPQDGQASGNGAAHSAQNLRPGRFSAPQFAQVMSPGAPTGGS